MGRILAWVSCSASAKPQKERATLLLHWAICTAFSIALRFQWQLDLLSRQEVDQWENGKGSQQDLDNRGESASGKAACRFCALPLTCITKVHSSDTTYLGAHAKTGCYTARVCCAIAHALPVLWKHSRAHIGLARSRVQKLPAAALQGLLLFTMLSSSVVIMRWLELNQLSQQAHTRSSAESCAKQAHGDLRAVVDSHARNPGSCCPAQKG